MPDTPYITVTDGRRSVQVPFTPGEMTLAALQRVVKINAPCHGSGMCGQCIIEVVQPDGSLKRELACFYPAQEMTVRVQVLRLVQAQE